jgi:hypothetical protein
MRQRSTNRVWNIHFLDFSNSRQSLCSANGSQLLGFLFRQSLGTLGELGLSLETHDTATPLADQVGIVIVLFEGKILKKRQLTLIGLVDTSQANDSGSLHVHESTETSLVLDNHEGNLHLAAQGRHPHDQFDRVDIVGNQDEARLLVFHQSGNVLESVLDLEGSLGRCLLAFGSRHGSFLDALLLGGRCGGAVLVEEGKDRHGFILANRLGKLVDRRRNLQTLVQHSALTLNAHVPGPLDEATQITTGGTNVATNGERAWAGRKERVRGLGDLGLGVASLGLGFGVLFRSL